MANEAQGTAAAGTRSRRADPNLAKQRANPLDSDASGVRVAFDGVQYQVAFPFNSQLASRMRGIPGADFDREGEVWTVPVAQYDALAKAVPAMRQELDLENESRADIENIAYGTALIKMEEQGVDDTVLPRLTNYHASDKPTVGELIAVNGRFAAQLTGFGKNDGAAFVTIHRLSDLTEEVFKGEKVAIQYNDKGRGQVTYRQPLEEKLDESLGKYVDGVKVIESEGKYKVSFDYNPVLSSRLQRVDGVEFHEEQKVWEVGTDKKAFVARAVNDMRKEVVADRADRKEMEDLAADKIDGVKVKDAFTKDGQTHTGKVLGANARYVLQHTGKEYAALHRADALSERPEIGKNVRVAYEKGKGKVADRSQSRGHEQER